MNKIIRNVLMAIALGSAGLAGAAVPTTIGYQGFLTNSLGEPRSGSHPITFRLYSVSSGGAALWTETHASVQVTRGVLNVTLGSVTAINLPFDNPYWLGVQIGADPEMAPRQALVSSPYTRRAAVANAAGIADALSDIAVVDAYKLVGTIALARLPSGIVADFLSPSAVVDTNKLVGTIALARLPSGIDAAYFQGNLPDDFAPANESSSYIWNRSPEAFEQFAGFNVGGPARVAGELQVGSVRLGNPGTFCSASVAGTLRWTGSAFEGCNGSAWGPLGGAPAPMAVTASGTSTTEFRSAGGNPTDIGGVSLTVNVSPGASLLVEYSGPLGSIDPSTTEPIKRENSCKFQVAVYSSTGAFAGSTKTMVYGPTGVSITFGVNIVATIGPLPGGGQYTLRPQFQSLMDSTWGICRLEGGHNYRLFAKEL